MVIFPRQKLKFTYFINLGSKTENNPFSKFVAFLKLSMCKNFEKGSLHSGPCKITFEIQGFTLFFSFYVTKLRKNWEIQFETVHQIALSCMCSIVFTEVDSNFCKQKAAKTAIFQFI